MIRAELPGLVAYGGAKDNYYTSRYYEGISEGATLKTGQPIITIPDMSKLGVEVNIHESHIKKIELDQKVYITAESVPDKTLIGTHFESRRSSRFQCFAIQPLPESLSGDG